LESVCWGNSTVGSNPTLSAPLRQGFGGQALFCFGREFESMWYVYVLKSLKDGQLYVGSTNDLRRRLKEHKDGLCESTRHRRPMNLEAYIAVQNGSVARSLEKYLKSGSGVGTLRKRTLASEVLKA
jgi:putative endonuclease